jgi:small subunit ribosomal protein S16
MVRIRLRRTGAKNNPAYRVVVADQASPRDGAFIDTIGHYLPTRQPAVVEIDEAKARKWLSQGAQPSETVASILRHKGILDANNKIAAPTSEAATTA